MALSPLVVALVGVVLIALMFGLGASMKDADIVAVSRRPKGILVGLCSQFIWMPFLAYASALACGWADDDATDIQRICTILHCGASTWFTFLTRPTPRDRKSVV